MKLLYIISGTQTEGAQGLMQAQSANHEVSSINLDENQNYAEILDAIKAADQVISMSESGVANLEGEQ
ncbi:MAG: hypothetical protein QNL04_07760 [SAR324 cluster bacterium]|nr:hypothetical protein [SAR324 cluster bacterium]